MSTIRELLESQDKERLIAFLLQEASENLSLQGSIITAFSQEPFDLDLDEIRTILKEAFSDYVQDWQGDICLSDYGSTILSEMLHDIELSIDSKKLKRAACLLILLDEEISVLDGIEWEAGATEDRMHALVRALGYAKVPKAEKQALFDYLWDNHSDSLLAIRMCCYLATDKEQIVMMRSELDDQYLDSELIFLLVLRFGTEEDIQTFLDGTVRKEKYYQMMIEQAFDQEQYNTALTYFKQAKECCGYCSQWNSYAIKAYEKLEMIDEARELVFESVVKGEYVYFEKLQKMTDPEQWDTTLEQLCDAIEKQKNCPYWYPKFLVETGKKVRLLAYLQNHPSNVLPYYEVLLPEYQAQLRPIFFQYCRHRISSNSSRQSFENLAQTLVILRSIGGAEEVTRCISELITEYPNKNMLKQELRKAGFSY